jgi:hypothetical protein
LEKEPDRDNRKGEEEKRFFHKVFQSWVTD